MLCWSLDVPRVRSTWRELSAVWLVLQVVTENCHVRWFTDNQNVVRILQIGSRKPEWHAIAL